MKNFVRRVQQKKKKKLNEISRKKFNIFNVYQYRLILKRKKNTMFNKIVIYQYNLQFNN